jgi:RNA polymerase sigma-70 factor (ECF subfamily)
MKKDTCNGLPAEDEEVRLIAQIVAGNTGLFYQLISPHHSRLLRIALALVRNEADAQDVVQESLLKALTNLDRFRAEARLSTWLISITLNEAKNHLRARRHIAFEPIDSYSEELWSRSGDSVTPYRIVEQNELRSLLLRAVSGLHPDYRNIYFLREIHELSTQRAAEELGIPIPLAKTRLHRARRLLRSRLSHLIHPLRIERLRGWCPPKASAIVAATTMSGT